MQSLQSLMNHLERSPEWRASANLRQILVLWPKLVGVAVAQHSQPVKVQRGILQVSVSSAAWAQTLMFERSRILTNIHQHLPQSQAEIRELRFAAAQWQRLHQPRTKNVSTALSDHPSWAALPQSVRTTPPESVNGAFRRWAGRKQAQLASQSICPECGSPCPNQELQRWSMCAICMTHRWHTQIGQARKPLPKVRS